ncbi:MAG: hypothetical protein AAFW46_08185 [Pseudomonadota bacterium]
MQARLVAIGVAAAAVVVLAGCQASTTSSAAAPPLVQPSAQVAAAAAAGGSRGLMPEAARLWIECGLREYYTAPAPISPRAAIDRCPAEGRRYIDVYFAEYNLRAKWKRSSLVELSATAADELAAIVGAAGS